MSIIAPNIVQRKTMKQIQESLPLQWQKDLYGQSQIDRILIDGTPFTGYLEYSHLDELTYKEQPERALDGQIKNLNGYITFLTPRIVIKYSMANIEEYRDLMQLIQSKREFIVEYYDIVHSSRTVANMYFAPQKLPKLFNQMANAMGVIDLEVELIGTNVPLSQVSVTYDSNSPVSSIQDRQEGSPQIKKGQQLIIGQGITIPNDEPITSEGFTFNIWNSLKNGKGLSYSNTQIITLEANMILYAQWTASTSFTLSYNYGYGEVKIGSNGLPLYNKGIIKGNAIGDIPDTNPKIVLYNGVDYQPYKKDGENWLRGWYWVNQLPDPPIEPPSPITPDTIYDYSFNATMYQIFQYEEYVITLNENYTGGEITAREAQEYNSKIYPPNIPIRTGYTFIGWFENADPNPSTDKPFAFNHMPPLAITLYAVWEAK